MRLHLKYFLIAIFLLTGCDQQALFDKLVPKEEAEFSKRFLSNLATRDFVAAEQSLEPSLLGGDARSRLQKLADLFPSVPPLAIDIVGALTTTSQNREQHNLTFQYRYPDKWLLANVVLVREKGKPLRVAGAHVNPLADSLQNLNRFTFAGKDVAHYVVFLLAIAIPLFVVRGRVCANRPSSALYVCYFIANWGDRLLVEATLFLIIFQKLPGRITLILDFKNGDWSSSFLNSCMFKGINKSNAKSLEICRVAGRYS
jgi:hypothetical protein